MNVSIQPTTLDGEFWVDVILDGEMRRHGPYNDADDAEIAATRLAATCRALHAEVVLAAPAAGRHP